MISDKQTEVALLSNLIQYGFESYQDVFPTGLSEDSFSNPTNKIIYKSLAYLFEKDHKEIDKPLINNAICEVGYDKWYEQNDIKSYIDEITLIDTKVSNARSFASKLRKLEVANRIAKAAEEIQSDAHEITGEESLSDIYGIAENKLSSLASLLSDTSVDPVNIGQEIAGHVDNLINKPVDQVGVPTGFPIFDKYIGGGLRKHAITVIAARPKGGKSTFCKIVGKNVAELGVPVLILDTEMETEDQINRLLASVSEVDLTEIETGKFATDTHLLNKIRVGADKISKLNIQHKNIAGMPLEAQLAIARKWIIKDVGLNKKGKAKDCVLIYDYIKIMDGKDLGKIQEHQAIGFLMTALQNFAVRYDIPILTAAQLNRDGISVEDTSAIGASDRISMYCSSVSILKWKSEEERFAEQYNFGNQKLIPIISRYGPPIEPGDYINIKFDHDKNNMTENGIRANSQTGLAPKYSKKPKKSDEVEPFPDLPPESRTVDEF